MNAIPRRPSQAAAPRRRRLLSSLLAAGAVTAATTLAPHPAAAFSGEDPLHGNPWWHQRISRNALVQCGFSHVPDGEYKEHDSKADKESAAEAIAWHADYIDSYLYNPLWWVKGGIPRMKASLSAGPELEKLHFDDLFSSDQVHRAFRHYTSGTVAGLIWAARNNDVPAAQNILGVSLHAVQDFYSHSNWVDAPSRRTTTYFTTPAVDKATLTLFTGAYEEQAHLGVKHHGKLAIICSLLNQPGVRDLMDVLTSGISPLSNTSLAQQYKDCKNGVTVTPYVPKLSNDGQPGGKFPENVVYLAPPGIALDNSWVAPIGTEQRGIKDVKAQELFEFAKKGATDASVQWIKKLEAVMVAKGGIYESFWKRLKEEGATDQQRWDQYESFRTMPYTFLSAGVYPPKQSVAGAYTDEEVYLRIRIKTSSESGAGTNADIKLLADGKPVLDKHGHPVVLDYMRGETPVLAYNDFEAGDDDVYVAGPFKTLPKNISFYNDAADGEEVLKAFGRSFERIFTETIRDLGITLVGGHADHIGGNKKLWFPEELATITATGKPFTIRVDGKDEGVYQVTGTIKRTAQSPGDSPTDWAEFQVTMDKLECIKESKFDRGSNSDEPFVMAAFSSLPGGVQPFMTLPFKDVDTGEVNAIGKSFTARVPKRYGVINLPINIMEEDYPSKSERDELLKAWITGMTKDEEREKTERGFLAALDTNMAAAWKVESVQVYAWTRGGQTVRAGQVFGVDGQPINQSKWVDSRKQLTINLNANALQDSGVKVDDLINGYDGKPTDVTPTNDPAPTATEEGWVKVGPWWSVRVEHADYGAPRGDRNVGIVLGVRNDSGTARTATPNSFRTLLQTQAGGNIAALGAPQNVYAAGAADAPAGNVPFETTIDPGARTTIRFNYSVGADPQQREVRALALWEQKILPLNNYMDGQRVDLPVPALPLPPQDKPAGPTAADQELYKKLKGVWKTSHGTVLVVRQDEQPGPQYILIGEATQTFESGRKLQAERITSLRPEAGGMIFGYWQQDFRIAESGSRVEIRMSPDGNSFTGTLFRNGVKMEYNGTRVTETAGGPGGPGGTGGPTNPVGDHVVHNAPETGAAIGEFQTVGSYDVRVDTVKMLRGGQHLDVTFTVRNSGFSGSQEMGAGDMSCIVTDGEGLGFPDKGNLYKPGVETITEQERNPQIAGEDEVKVRKVFDMPEGATALKTLSAWNSRGVIRKWDLRPLKLAGDGGVEGVLPEGLTGAAPEFFPVGDWDVRVDGWRKVRSGDKFELFLTMKNSTDAPQSVDPSMVYPALVGENGLVIERDGNIYRANGANAKATPYLATIMPGTTGRVRFVLEIGEGEEPTHLRIGKSGDDTKAKRIKL